MNGAENISLSGGGGGFLMCLRDGFGRMIRLATMRQARTTYPPECA